METQGRGGGRKHSRRSGEVGGREGRASTDGIEGIQRDMTHTARYRQGRWTKRPRRREGGHTAAGTTHLAGGATTTAGATHHAGAPRGAPGTDNTSGSDGRSRCLRARTSRSASLSPPEGPRQGQMPTDRPPRGLARTHPRQTRVDAPVYPLSPRVAPAAGARWGVGPEGAPRRGPERGVEGGARKGPVVACCSSTRSTEMDPDRGSGWEELEAPTTSPVGDDGSQAGGTQAVVACRYPARRRPPRSPATRRHSPEGGSVWPMEGSRQAGDRGSNTSTERQRSAPRLSQMQPLRVSEAWPLFLRRRRVQVARGGSGGRTGGRHVASRPLHVWLAL